MHVTEITQGADFSALEDSWNTLLSRSADDNIFLSFEWLSTWWQHFHSRYTLKLIVLEDDGRIEGIVPLMARRYVLSPLHRHVLESLGAPESDYWSFIFDTERCGELFSALVAHMKEERYTFGMVQIPDRSNTYSLIAQSDPVAETHAVRMTPCPFIPLSTDWDAFDAGLGKALKRGLIRKEKRIRADRGALEYRLCREPRETAARMGDFWRLHDKLMRFRRFEPWDNARKSFYSDVAGKFAEKGWLDLSFLLVEGEAISASLGFSYGNRHYSYQGAWDPEYARYSPGNLHIYYDIRRAFEEKKSEFDFLTGGEPYKYQWTAEFRTNYRVYLHPPGYLHRGMVRLLDKTEILRSMRMRPLRENYHVYQYVKRQQRLRRDRIHD